MLRGRRSSPSPAAWAGALSSAILLILAQPPCALYPLSFLALAPLAFVLASCPRGPEGRWQATLLGFGFGLLFWALALVWVPLVMGPFFSWAFPGYALLLLLLGLLSGLLGRLVHILHRKRGLPLALALPLAWVAVEWVKAYFPFGLDFPWLGLGVALTPRPELLGLAEWTGERGVAFWVAAVNGLVAAGLLGSGRWGRGRWWLSAAIVVGLPSLLGVARARTLPLTEGPRIVVVGTRVPPELRLRPRESLEASLQQLAEALSGPRPSAPALVVLPEATIPLPLDEETEEEGVKSPGTGWALGELRELARGLRAPLLFGALGRAPAEGEEDLLTNSAFFLSPGEPFLDRYDKVHLVPGMEAGSYARGRTQKLFRAGDWLVAPLICYESLFGRSARRRRVAGAHLLANLTSDIWFGDPRFLPGSLFLHQHPAHLVLRAVENRISVARAANGGFSFLLDPLGHVVSDLIPPSGGSTEARISLFPGTTFFARFGDWVGPGCALLCLLLSLLPSVRKGPRLPSGQGADSRKIAA